MVAMNVWPTDAADGSVANEARWRKMGRLWAPPSIDPAAGAAMAPTLVFPNLTVKAGACWVDGHFCELPGDQVLAVTANGLVVVRFDPAANSAQLLYLDGVSVPTQSPIGIYELPIAQMIGSALTDLRVLNYQTRFGGAWNRAANQSIPHATVTGVSFDSEVADIGNWAPPMPVASFTCPPNGQGIYSITFIYTFGAAITNAYAYINAGTKISAKVPTELITGYGVVSLPAIPLKPGDIVGPAVYQASGGARNLNASLDIWRVSP